MPLPQPSTSPFPSGVGQVTLVGSDGVTPLLFAPTSITPGTKQALAAVPYTFNGNVVEEWNSNWDTNFVPAGSYTVRQNISSQINVNAERLVVAVKINSAPNTSETLTIQYLLNVNGQGTGSTAQGNLSSFVLPIGTSLQTNMPQIFYLGIGPALTGTPDDTTHYKLVSVPLTRLFTIVILPSGASVWNYQVDGAYIL